jgi:hypothetical protein
MARLKGLVLEAGNNWALILSEQGEYKKITTKTLLHVGETWQEPTGYMTKYAIAAAILLVFIGAAFSILPVVAYAQVSSGIELGLNRWEWVVSARSLNDEGRQLLQEINLQGKTLDQAVELIVNKTLINSDSEEKEIVINVVTKKPGDEQDKQRIMEKVDIKVKWMLDQYKTKTNVDNRNSDSNIEHKILDHEVESNKFVPSKKNDRINGQKSSNEDKDIKAQQGPYRNVPDTEIDDENQKSDKENTTYKINKGQNSDAQSEDDKTKEKYKEKPEKEPLKSWQPDRKNNEADNQSNNRKTDK